MVASETGWFFLFLLYHDPETDKVKILLVDAKGFLDEEFQRTLGSLELVAMHLKVLYLFYHFPYKLFVFFDINVEFLCLVKNTALTGKVRNQYPLRIPYEFRLNMFIGLWISPDCTHVNATLVGKCTMTNIWLVLIRKEICHFVNKKTQFPEVGKTFQLYPFVPHFQDYIWYRQNRG